MKRQGKRCLSLLILLILAIALGCATRAEAAVEFVCVIKADGTGDYSTLASWEAANQCDLVSSATRVFSGSKTLTVNDGAGVTLYRAGVAQTLTGTVCHAGSTQILVKSISGAATPQANDQWRVDGSNYFTISNVGDSAIATARIDGSWSTADDSALTIYGWTTSATNYIRIYTTSVARHSGRWDDTNSYRIEAAATANDTHLVDIKENYVRIEGLQIHLTNSGGYTGCSAIYIGGQDTPSEIIINNNILKGSISGSNSDAIGIYGNNANITAKIYNNIIYDFLNGTTASYGISTAIGGTYYLYNNTVYGNYVGINIAAGTITAKNNLANGNNTDYSGTIGIHSNNIAEDATSPDNTLDSKVVAFLNESGNDFHLAAADTAAADAGVSLSSEFEDDIDSDSRPQGSGWDIGADEGGDNTAPVLETVTASALYTVDVKDTITLTFDEPMDTSTIANVSGDDGCRTLIIRYYNDSDCSGGACTGRGVVIPTKYATVEWNARGTVATIKLDERTD